MVPCKDSSRGVSQIYVIKQDQDGVPDIDLVKIHFSIEKPDGFVSQMDSRALEVIKRTLRKVGHHYEIGLIWNSYDVKLPDSYPISEKRLVSLEKS